MGNRLARSTSPYLLQHADNPVDWWEWGPDAFAEAVRLDRPILLSVGYAACHWCHVMAHESFEDEGVAAAINSRFVPIKVDREERPDVDAVFMQATQAMSGQGGWPMTVFLTPERRPFYAGTYFPPQPRHGLPSFSQLLDAISQAWQDRRGEVVDSATSIADQLAAAQPESLAGRLTADDLRSSLAELRRTYDPVYAGFGRAPKFPPSMVVEALLRFGGDDALTMAGSTLEAMARGGIFDQLAGGFARYSVDAAWVVPHFEKMLYDNALLLGAYAHWWRLTEDPMAARVVRQTVGWLLAEMRTPQGAFAASLDADSRDQDGRLREGAFYVWTPDQLVAELGEDEGQYAAQVFGVTAAGTFEHGQSTLQLRGEPPEWHDQSRDRLLAARSRRTRPALDDKVVAAWNGWLVEALATAALVFDEPDWLVAATEAAELIWRVHWDGARLRRTSRAGVVGPAPGILEDYAAMTLACTRLAAVHASPAWIERAEILVAVITTQFDDGHDGFFDTADDAERLFTRPQDPTDNATPSGLSSTVHALRLLGELTGSDDLLGRAERAAASAAELVRKAPRFAGWLLADAVTQLSRPAVQVAIAGDPSHPRTSELARTAYRLAPAGSVVVVGAPDAPGIALLADRAMVGGSPTAYVCRHFVCRLPVTTPEELAAGLGQVAR